MVDGIILGNFLVIDFESEDIVGANESNNTVDGKKVTVNIKSTDNSKLDYSKLGNFVVTIKDDEGHIYSFNASETLELFFPYKISNVKVDIESKIHDDNYSNNNPNNNPKIVDINNNCNITLEDMAGEKGGIYNLTSSLSDSFVNIPGKIVNFYLDSILIDTNFINGDGILDFEYRPHETAKFAFIASFVNVSGCEGFSNEAYSEIIKNSVNLSVINVGGNRNSKVDLIARLLDQFGNGISGEELELYSHDSKILGKVITNNSREAILEYNVDLDTTGYYVKYLGNDNYSDVVSEVVNVSYDFITYGDTTSSDEENESSEVSSRYLNNYDTIVSYITVSSIKNSYFSTGVISFATTFDFASFYFSTNYIDTDNISILTNFYKNISFVLTQETIKSFNTNSEVIYQVSSNVLANFDYIYNNTQNDVFINGGSKPRL